MKINLSNPDNDYVTHIDPDVNDVMITEAFLGVKFVTDDGEELSISMKDSGFEIMYYPQGENGPLLGVTLNNGEVMRTGV